MFKIFKTVSFIIVISLAFTTISCLDTAEEPVQRTPDMEAAELNQALTNLEAKGYDIDTTELGIYYVTNEEGEGAFPQAGDTCYLEYTGYLLDGTFFDASQNHYEDAIWEFIFKDIDKPLTPGFENGIALMNKGTELNMIIPSNLAYGELGWGIIPPYSTLLFSAVMHDLKPNAE